VLGLSLLGIAGGSGTTAAGATMLATGTGLCVATLASGGMMLVPCAVSTAAGGATTLVGAGITAVSTIALKTSTGNQGEIARAVESAGSNWTSSQESTLNNIVDHSYQKHVIDQNEFGSFFKNPQQWKEYLKSVMQKPSDYFQGGGKTLYWDDRYQVIIVDNPGNPTAFKPDAGKSYFLGEKLKLMGK
jgi:filamentous hemagglutinin